VSQPTHGVLTLNTHGGFTSLPSTNYNGPESFTYQANDGALNSGLATVSITITGANDAPVAVNDSYTTPEDTLLNVSAAGVLANDSDVDGDALSAILVSEPTQGVLALNTNGGFTYLPAINYSGTDRFTYKANDGLADSGIATVSITIIPVVIECLPLTTNAPTFNWQTSLFDQKVHISNSTAIPIPALQVSISGLREGVRVMNAAGELNGISFVQYNQELAPGTNVELTIEFHVTDRKSFEAQFCAKPVLKSTPTQQDGTIVDKDRMMFLADGSFMIEFSSVPGRVYEVQYSSDMQNWKAATPKVSNGSNRIQWIDNGPPKTESFPSKSEQSRRYYRVIMLP